MFTGETELLEEALPLLRSAIGDMPPRHSLRWIAVGNLGLCLAALYRTGADVPGGAEGAEILREAIEALPPDHAERAWLASVLRMLPGEARGLATAETG